MTGSTRRDVALLPLVGAATLLALLAPRPPAARAQDGTVVRETVRARALEKTLTGESADRKVSVYLPPGYGKAPRKRYPTLYLLHGIGDTDEVWTRGKRPWTSIQSVMDRGVAE